MLYRGYSKRTWFRVRWGPPPANQRESAIVSPTTSLTSPSGLLHSCCGNLCFWAPRQSIHIYVLGRDCYQRHVVPTFFISAQLRSLMWWHSIIRSTSHQIVSDHWESGWHPCFARSPNCTLPMQNLVEKPVFTLVEHSGVVKTLASGHKISWNNLTFDKVSVFRDDELLNIRTSVESTNGVGSL